MIPIIIPTCFRCASLSLPPHLLFPHQKWQWNGIWLSWDCISSYILRNIGENKSLGFCDTPSPESKIEIELYPLPLLSLCCTLFMTLLSVPPYHFPITLFFSLSSQPPTLLYRCQHVQIQPEEVLLNNESCLPFPAILAPHHPTLFSPLLILTHIHTLYHLIIIIIPPTAFRSLFEFGD